MINRTYLKYNSIPLMLALVSILFYVSFAYDLNRADTIKLFSLYAALCYVFYKLMQVAKSQITLLTILAIVFRLVFILAIPNLSQDFYRFIWDASLLQSGINPYLFTPDTLVSQGDYASMFNIYELHQGMGALSAGHFSNYPPLNQLCFLIGHAVPGHSILSSVIGMRLLIIAADIGTLHFGRKLLKRLQLPEYTIFWYLLNPFIIIELTGNLHFEGAMVFFLVWSLYLLHKGKWIGAAFILGCSVAMKLITLLFLPLIWKYLGWKKGFLFCTVVGLTTVVSFLPFYSEVFISNYSETVGLWFQNFEFNASLYYLFREIGFWISGYNQIAIIGKVMAGMVFIVVMALALFKKINTIKTLISYMLLALAAYLFLSTTVHPWYVVTLVFLSVFTHYKFPLVWSAVIILSYSAYGQVNYEENLWLIAFEYLIVFTVFLLDLKKHNTVET